MKASYEEIYQDTKMIREKRKKMQKLTSLFLIARAVIASDPGLDPGERGNLLSCGHLGDCFGRDTPSQ
jgi:hypothetical protein